MEWGVEEMREWDLEWKMGVWDDERWWKWRKIYDRRDEAALTLAPLDLNQGKRRKMWLYMVTKPR